MINQNLKNEQKEVFFNTPKDLNIGLLFSDMANKFIPKIQCLLHLINRDANKGGYQLNSKNHTWFFGINTIEFSRIIKRLVDNNIIKLVSNHQSGEVSRVYKMVQPFTQSDSNKHVYNSDSFLFIQKFVADNYMVVHPKNSKFIKVAKTKVKKVSTDSRDILIQELRERISQLESMLNITPASIPKRLSIEIDANEPHIKEIQVMGAGVQIEGWNRFANIYNSIEQGELHLNFVNPTLTGKFNIEYRGAYLCFDKTCNNYKPYIKFLN